MIGLIKYFLTILLLFLLLNVQSQNFGIWTSETELAAIPMTGESWELLLKGADNDLSSPDVADQDDNTNADVLAAAIVSLRLKAANDLPQSDFYKEKVTTAIELLVEKGHPGGTTLSWARETGAYALAADLVDYRTAEFENWLKKMADEWLGSDLNITLRAMFERRPNNWGTMAFGSLCAIYWYLEDYDALNEVRDYLIAGIEGPNPGFTFHTDLSWQADESNPLIINPCDSEKDGFNLDGLLPEEMRRGDSFQVPPEWTGYVWEGLQGILMGAYILERYGMPIWEVGDKAIYRAVYALQIRLENDYGAWAAEGDDLWMLPFIDHAYNTDFACDQLPRMWEHGKNAGWAYILGGDDLVDCGGNYEIETCQTSFLDFKKHSAFEFHIFPNPANDHIYAQIVGDSKENRVEVYIQDIFGQLVFQEQLLSQNLSKINLQNFDSGVYLIKMRIGGVEKWQKFMVR